MSWPALPKFGIVDNPLVISPFATSDGGGSILPANLFLLMTSEHFKLMNGEEFALTG